MKEERVSFFSEGDRVSGILRAPDAPGDGPLPAVVQGPGWLGLKDAKLYLRYHKALTDAGLMVLIFDYRGSGDSEGPTDLISPSRQLEDLMNAVTYLSTRQDVDANNIGVFGSGGTGGANAIFLGAIDKRIKCVVAQVPIADGEDWLKRMRSESEWYEFLDRVDNDRKRRVLDGESELVHPREEIMVPSAERRTTAVKKDVDSRVPQSVRLSSAEEVIAYRPIDVVGRVSPRPLLIICVDNDPVTPTDHALALYDKAGSPKRLIVQRGTTHYGAYEQYGRVVAPEIVNWFKSYLNHAPFEIRSEGVDL